MGSIAHHINQRKASAVLLLKIIPVSHRKKIYLKGAGKVYNRRQGRRQ
ncbi:MAG: hypothetical protein ICV84_24995 [Flavisolibacter sp.]|nr:hypothetical protein [Flavisolibacter sp.]